MNESAIFARAIQETDPAVQRAYLDEACRGDARLRQRMDKLIAAHENPASLLEPPCHDSASLPADAADDDGRTRDWLDSNGPPAAAGDRIGPYKLLQEIGEGGMGVVYMAAQVEPVRRRVALKIIKPGMDSRQVIARFEAERQALAMMDHPNIAKVLDAGTTVSGHPFFVMELVQGPPITDYCDQEQLHPRERLQLFTDVCRAAQHAHQKGVIHRDLKPSNILVAEYDGRPVPKIIDFGVAKATGPQLTDKTLFTEFGQIIGTLEYMSPEQARRNQLDVDTRSDIYSLGIVLYVLLAGETPFGPARFREAAWDEMLRIVREEEPPRPSLKIGNSQALDQIAARRNVEPQRLSAIIRGDLDWIVMRALEKDCAARYASANELADDIERHLAAQPVIARPPATLDRMTKFVRRHRRAVVMVSVLAGMVCLLALAWVSVWADRNRQIAQRTQRVNEAIEAAAMALGTAVASPVYRNDEWLRATANAERIRDLLADGAVTPDVGKRASSLLASYEQAGVDRELATKIEDVVINGATKFDLESWTKMESDFREMFRKHGFNLDRDEPAELARRIREHPSAARWTDALELWIGTRGQLQAFGGPRLTREIMQPWAEARCMRPIRIRCGRESDVLFTRCVRIVSFSITSCRMWNFRSCRPGRSPG